MIFGVSFVVHKPLERPPLDLRSLGWMLPWLLGMGLISYLGNDDGIGVIPDRWDLAIVVVFSFAIFYLGVPMVLSRERVAEAFREEEAEAESLA